MAYQNFYATKLQNTIGAADTVIAVQTIPTVTAGRLVLEPRNAGQREIISYTGVAGATLTGVVRGLFGTTAKTHSSGSLVEMNFLAQDYTDLTDAFNTFAATNNDWRTAVTTVTSVVNNGNRSYTLAVNTDLSAVVTPGMRLRSTRTVAAPTQSTLLNGTNQYFTRTTPTNMNQTDDITVMQWIKPTAYQLGIIQSKTATPGTDGWRFYIQADGRIIINGNNRYAGVYQSVPLNKWVHVAMTLDMSAGVVTAYIDGVAVSTEVLSAGATSFTSAGSYSVGAASNGANPFAGKISQAAYFNAVLPAATIRQYMSQGFTGSETNLISAYSFNNSINDLNTVTANNLTANGSAVATNTDSPFGGQGSGAISSTLDYAIVQAITSSTITVQVPEGCTIPTSGGVTALAYSAARSPFGFPNEKQKWRIQSYLYIESSTAAAGSAWYNLSGQGITLPIGNWMLGYKVTLGLSLVSAGRTDARATLSTQTGAETNPTLTAGQASGNALTFFASTVTAEDGVSVSTQTQYYLISGSSSIAGTIFNFGSKGSTPTGQNQVYADNGYL